MNCGKNHYVSKCPTIPKDKKKWDFKDWLKFRNEESGNGGSKKRKTANRTEEPESGSTVTSSTEPGESSSGLENETVSEKTHPRGGRSTAKKKVLASAGTESGSKSENAGSEVDGTVEITGVSGYYVCDGGCDRATINKEFGR